MLRYVYVIPSPLYVMLGCLCCFNFFCFINFMYLNNHNLCCCYFFYFIYVIALVDLFYVSYLFDVLYIMVYSMLCYVVCVGIQFYVFFYVY